MKKIDIFCTSQTSTAIRHENSPSSTPSSSSSAFLLPGGAAAIDRHNPIIRDPKRAPKPALPQPPKFQNPNPIKKKSHFKEINGDGKPSKNDSFNGGGVVKKIWKCTNPGDFITPPGSSRFLLTERAPSDPSSSDSNVSAGAKKQEISEVVAKTEDALFKGEKPPSLQEPEQVVVMRVSLHCRGCEKKLRKHLSRMKGVSSFNIEFAAKKVTVTGNVSPVCVLTSISKVKNVQLWSPTISSSIPIMTSTDQINNDSKEAGA